jgi:3-hydroxymyristoyl/3-hydroxydecanoyl-(acyl carrier protein) dehydratase
MADHFAAFSFVDRITESVPGRRARGTFAVPLHLRTFPSCLVAEAVGQLAAWVAMAHVGFRVRPVAALAGQTRFLGNAAPGDSIVLTAELESCDDEAVSYAGWAEVDGVRVLELSDCFGAMLPVEDFDSPAALRERFALLRGDGAPPGRFQGIAPAEIDTGGGVPGESATATLRVPAEAAFFADHFPRRPVYPATLLLDAQIGMALRLAAEAPNRAAGMTLMPARMTRVKVRAFTSPGQTLELAANLMPPGNGYATIAMTARAGGKPVATAQLEVAAMDVRR